MKKKILFALIPFLLFLAFIFAVPGDPQQAGVGGRLRAHSHKNAAEGGQLNWVNAIIQKPFIDVREYGVTGDGVTDDTVAIQAVFDALNIAGGGCAYFPDGTYLVTAMLTVYANTSIKGNGVISRINSTITGAPLFSFQEDSISIEDMWLYGAGTDVVAGDHAISGRTAGNLAVNDILVDRMLISNFKGAGISGHYLNSRFLNSHITGIGDAGIYCSYKSAHNIYLNLEVDNVGQSGIDCNGADNKFLDLILHDCGGGVADPTSWAGLLIWYVAGGDFTADRNIAKGITSYNNSGHGILVGGNDVGASPKSPSANQITKNTCYGHTDIGSNTVLPAGIAVFGGEGNIVEDNNCYNNFHNYVFSGYAGTSKNGISVKNNNSLQAEIDGFHFTTNDAGDSGYATPSGSMQEAYVVGNVDRMSVRDGFHFTITTNLTNYVVYGNKSYSAGAYGFRMSDIAGFITPDLKNNRAYNPTTAESNFKELTIATGVIERVCEYHTIDGEGDAADELVTINGGLDGIELTLQAENNARAITVKHATGNIELNAAADKALGTTHAKLKLIYDAISAKWCQIAHSTN